MTKKTNVLDIIYAMYLILTEVLVIRALITEQQALFLGVLRSVFHLSNQIILLALATYRLLCSILNDVFMM